jgi:hypothetical protein
MTTTILTNPATTTISLTPTMTITIPIPGPTNRTATVTGIGTTTGGAARMSETGDDVDLLTRDRIASVTPRLEID